MKARHAALVLLSALAMLGCDPFRASFDAVEPAVMYRAAALTEAPAPASRQLRVMNWNVKFGGGRLDFFFDCHGDRSQMTEAEVLAHLEGLAAKIRQVDPDVLILQEVDAESKRSAYVDQVQWLLDHTDLSYGAYASQWRVDIVPQDGIGRVDSGNAILARWPLASATRRALAEIGDQDAITKYFWLRRNTLEARVVVPGVDDLWIVGVHTAAFSTDGTKKKHIDSFKAVLDRLAGQGAVFVGGGDLNTLPPGSLQTSGFPDSACPPDGEFDADDYSEEGDWTQALYDAYTAAIPLADYQADNAPHLSHTTDGGGFWNRKLDYLFTNLARVDGLVHQDASAGGMDTMSLSDHAPLVMTVALP